MDSTHTTFRRLSDRDLHRFTFSVLRSPAWKIGFFIILSAVLVQWVMR